MTEFKNGERIVAEWACLKFKWISRIKLTESPLVCYFGDTPSMIIESRVTVADWNLPDRAALKQAYDCAVTSRIPHVLVALVYKNKVVCCRFLMYDHKPCPKSEWIYCITR